MAYGSPLSNRIPPTVGSTAGPDYATTVNNMLTDLRDVVEAKVTPAGITINADLPLGNNNLTGVGSVALQNKGSAYATASSIYERSGELYFNDSSARQVRLTNGGNLNASGIGGIGGDYGGANPAIVKFTESSNTYDMQEATNAWAKVFLGGIGIKRQGETSPNAASIAAPASLASAYTLTLPAALPGSGTEMVTLTSAGVLSSTPSPTFTNVTVGGTLGVTGQATFTLYPKHGSITISLGLANMRVDPAAAPAFSAIGDEIQTTGAGVAWYSDLGVPPGSHVTQITCYVLVRGSADNIVLYDKDMTVSTGATTAITRVPPGDSAVHAVQMIGNGGGGSGGGSAFTTVAGHNYYLRFAPGGNNYHFYGIDVTYDRP